MGFLRIININAGNHGIRKLSGTKRGLRSHFSGWKFGDRCSMVCMLFVQCVDRSWVIHHHIRQDVLSLSIYFDIAFLIKLGNQHFVTPEIAIRWIFWWFSTHNGPWDPPSPAYFRTVLSRNVGALPGWGLQWPTLGKGGFCQEKGWDFTSHGHLRIVTSKHWDSAKIVGIQPVDLSI